MFMTALCLILALSFTACGSSSKDDPEDPDTDPEKTSDEDVPEKDPDYPSHPEMKKVADHLYEVTVTEDFDWNTENPAVKGGFSCSAVQNGRFRGRNYDWFYADTDLCIIHAPKTAERRHASVGIADMSFIVDKDGNFDSKLLPFVTVDGINDAGVCIQVNVMPYGENGEFSHNSDPADDLNGARVTRYVLDYADSVDDAIAKLKEKEIFSAFGTEEELHWMISGPAKDGKTYKTVVVEIFPDGMHVTEKFIDDKPIMTNFNVSNFDGTTISVGWGAGYERWQILSENFDQANSVMGTFDLMEKVFYSKMYDLYGDRFWYSEYALTDLSEYYEDKEELKALLGEETYDFYMDNFGGIYYTPEFWDGETVIHGDISKTGILAPVVKAATESYNRQELGDQLWITVETAVYDLEAKTLDVSVRESQDHYRFTIE